MTNYQKGYSYEDFVEAVYNAILEAEGNSEGYKAIKLQRRKKITSKSGTKAQAIEIHKTAFQPMSYLRRVWDSGESNNPMQCL